MSGVLHGLDGEVNDLDSKRDLIHKSESEKRLNLLCGFLSLCLLICATVFMLICFRIFAPPTIKYYENKITNETYSSKPNVAILLPGGYMTSYSWNTSSNSSYPKLPEAYSYGMACFDQKLYAFGIPTYNGMTVIHPNGTHRLIGNRGLNPFQSLQRQALNGQALYGQAWFDHIIVIDKYLWLVGLAYNQGAGHGGTLATDSKTFMYSFIKNQWLTGPSLPKFMSMEYGCTVSLNRSQSLLIGGYFEDSPLTNRLVIAFDFSTQNWVWNYKMVPYSDTDYYHYFSCSIVHGKLNSVVTVLVTEKSPNGFSYKVKADLWDFDFSANAWIHKFSLASIEGRGKLAVVQGILHYFPFLNYGQETLGYYYNPHNKSFHPVSDPSISFDYEMYDVEATLYTVPCYVNSLKD